MGVPETGSRRRAWCVGVATLFVAVSLGMSACSENGSSAAAPSASAELTMLDDGEHFGFASGFSDGVLEIELAELFVGDDAVSAAAADGEGEPPNPFYIRYLDVGLVRVPVSESAEINVLDNSADIDTKIIDTQTLAELYSGDTDASWVYSSLDQWPVIIKVDDAVAYQVIEQYLP